MKVRKLIWPLLFLLLSFTLLKDEYGHLFYVPKKWPKPVYNFRNNPLSSAKVELGRKLFYDPILSKDNSIACASCHSPYNAFAHSDHALSHGIRDQTGTRNAPALFNLAWQSSFMWDGAVHQLDVQALAPIHNPVEMDETLENVINKLKQHTTYPTLFYKAYKDSSITGEHVLKALSAFAVTLISSHAKYDSVLYKKAKFTDQELRGYKLYRKNCSTCHAEPLFSTYEYANNGLMVNETLNDVGQFKVSHVVEDSFKFKIPSLRNLDYSKPYMHDGRFKNLNQVINHYNHPEYWNKRHSKQLNDQMQLNDFEKVDLISFLLTLNDRNFIFNPYFVQP